MSAIAGPVIAELGQPISGTPLWIAAAITVVLMIAVVAIFVSEQRAALITRTDDHESARSNPSAVPRPSSTR